MISSRYSSRRTVPALRRLCRMGALTAFVGGYGPAANALYQAVMGPERELYEPWVKEWTP
jgi:hypothetical protein